jgi:ABC-type transporter Mla MlaB component
VRLRLEGELTVPWVTEVGRVCSGIVESRQPLSIDLKEVSFVDREGLRLLASLTGAWAQNARPCVKR